MQNGRCCVALACDMSRGSLALDSSALQPEEEAEPSSPILTSQDDIVQQVVARAPGVALGGDRDPRQVLRQPPARRGPNGPFTATDLFGLPDLPVYIVWSLPQATRCVVGIHCGACAWEQLCQAIPGGCYRPGVDRLRRLPYLSFAQETSAERLHRALALYYSESARHRACLVCSVWVWDSHYLPLRLRQ
eukprot:496009-Amphidinium_carterae.1